MASRASWWHPGCLPELPIIKVVQFANTYYRAVLASLLPGLRDLRTPLVTGYAWLIALWLSAGPERLMPKPSNRFVERIYEYSDLLGTSVSIATLSFLAYLIGSLLTVRRIGFSESTEQQLFNIPLLGWIVFWPITFLGLARQWLEYKYASTKRLDDWIDGIVARISAQGRPLSKIVSDGSEYLPKNFVYAVTLWDEHTYAADIAQDLGVDESSPQVALVKAERALTGALRAWLLGDEMESLTVKLQLERESIYDAYDRLSTEAELRLSLLIPLGGTAIAAGTLWSPWAYLLVLLPLVLGWQGMRLQSRAQERVIQALTSGVIESTVVNRLLDGQRLSDMERQAVDQRANAAAEACYEDLARLEEVIPRWSVVYLSRGNMTLSAEDQKEVRVEHDRILAKFEANIVLLNSPQREELVELMKVMRYAYDLPLRRGFGDSGWHPDSIRNITSACARYGRELLASHIRHEPLPVRPDQIEEYILANDERNTDLEADFAEEIHESEQSVAAWREARDLPKVRQPWK